MLKCVRENVVVQPTGGIGRKTRTMLDPETYETLYEYANSTMRLLFALSPILFVACVLVIGREDAETEQEKLAYSKTVKKS